MIRVLQLAACINRFDFIDNIVQYADPRRFAMGVAVGSEDCQIAEPVFRSETPRWVIPWRSRREIVTAACRLAGILCDWQADILHTHHYDESLIGWLATRLHRRTRLVVGRHYSDAIYRSATGLKRIALLGVERVMNRAATRIIVPSSSIVEILTCRQGADLANVDLIPYGFVAHKYAAPGPGARQEVRRELSLADRFVIGTFGRLHEEKGQRHLIEAMAMLRPRAPEVSLLIVGEGSERRNLERLIQDLGLADVVRLLGWRRDAMAVMAAVDAVVQPTLHEAFSQVMVEALWMARPLVMTDVSGARDVIKHGENGLIVPTGDPGALAEAIARLASDAALPESMGKAGREYVANNLSIEAIIPRYERAYLRAMGMGEGVKHEQV